MNHAKPSPLAPAGPKNSTIQHVITSDKSREESTADQSTGCLSSQTNKDLTHKQKPKAVIPFDSAIASPARRTTQAADANASRGRDVAVLPSAPLLTLAMAAICCGEQAKAGKFCRDVGL